MSNPKHYVNNKELLEEVKKYLKTCEFDEEGLYIHGSGRCSEVLGQMILNIVNGLASKANFRGYTYREDMVGEAIITILKYLKNFNPDKSNNAFSYISQIAYNTFITTITKQKRHSDIKQELFDSTDATELKSDRAINYTGLKIR